MKPSPDEAAKRWLTNSAMSKLERAPFAQADIDEVFDEPPTDAIRVGLQCLHAALEVARQRHAYLGAMLTIPLPWSDVLDLEAPNLSDLAKQPWVYGRAREVVGLYLVHPRLWSEYEEVEEYRRPISAPGVVPDGFAAYYRVWRTPGCDEYWRTIYVRTIDE